MVDVKRELRRFYMVQWQAPNASFCRKQKMKEINRMGNDAADGEEIKSRVEYRCNYERTSCLRKIALSRFAIWEATNAWVRGQSLVMGSSHVDGAP